VLVTRTLSQLAAQSEGKWTSKKKKRLEKYIVSSKIHSNFRGGNPLCSVNRTKSSREKNEL
jgi:hypothetical protein